MDRRSFLIAEICKLVSLLSVESRTYAVHVYRHFLGTTNGDVSISLCETDTHPCPNCAFFLIADFADGGEDTMFPCEIRRRDLRRLRDALMRDYGKRVLRGQIEIVPTE